MTRWPLARIVAFRFLVIYCGLYIFYTFLRFQTVPGLTQLYHFLWPAWEGLVTFFNDHLFHIRQTLVAPNNSTDTSFSWATQFTILFVSVFIAGVWSVIDRKRENYTIGEYWLKVSVRYFIAYFAIYYGIIKLFGLQMPFPSLSQLSTPLGDFSQTRIAWLSIGASPSYQLFSGIIETAAGLFLIFRRTTTLGLVLSVAVFANVVAINIGYDAPVKLMSIHFLLMSVWLLAYDYKRIIGFFFTSSPQENRSKIRLVAKIIFIALSVGITISISIRNYRSQSLVTKKEIFDVTHFSLGGDTSSLRWSDVVFYGVTGSMKTSDTTFIHRYERAYFSFEVDSASQKITIKRDYDDPDILTTLSYSKTAAGILQLKGVLHSDSLFVTLKRSKKKFRLSQPEFHWIQESSQ